MMPTLLIGDYIAVNKYTYGMRLPFTSTRIVDVDRPERGDVIVFRYPEDPSVVFIKRVVGLPGDRIGYHNKKLFINGEPVQQDPVGKYSDTGSGSVMTGADILRESFTSVTYDILVESHRLK